MKITLICTLLLFCSVYSTAQQPESIIKLSDGANSFVRDIAVSDRTEIYSAGYFENKIFINDTEYLSKGSSDIFITKHDSNELIDWVFTLGGVGEDRAHNISIAKDGSIYVCGYFSGDIILSNGDTINHIYSKDAILIKLSTTGELIWTKTIGSLGDDDFYDVATDGDSKPLVGGYISQDVSINTSVGTRSFNTTIAKPILVKLLSNGEFDWARDLSSTLRSYIYGLHYMNDNTILATGHFSGELSTPNNSKALSNGIQDIFIARFLPDGSYINQSTFGSAGDDAGYAITSTSSGIYLVGNFSKKVVFTNTDNIVSKGGRDGLLVKLNNNLVVQNTAQVSGPLSNQAYNLATNGTDIFISGSFIGSSSMDGTAGKHPRESRGGEDLYISKYDKDLALQWTQTAGSGHRTVATAIDYSNGHTWLAGLTYRMELPYYSLSDSIQNTSHPGSSILKLKDCEMSPTLVNTDGWLKPLENAEKTQWLNCNDDLSNIEGENKDSFFTDQEGFYAARITKNGCESITECYEYKENVSVSKVSEIESKVWPNPASGYINLTTEKPMTKVNVKNIFGSSIYEGLPQGNQLKTADWSNGTYYITFYTDEGRSTHKVIKID